MTKVRMGLPIVVASALVLVGCASGSGGSSVEEGNPPRDNGHTRSAELFLTQARTLGDVSRFGQALAAANNSILEEPQNPMGYFQAGRAQIGLEDYVAADTLFAIAMELYPAYEEEVRVEREAAWIDLFNRAIEPLDAGDADEGVRLLEAAEAIFHRRRPEALINLGVSYSNTGRTADAIDAYGAALDIIRGPHRTVVDSATAAGWVAREQSVTFNRAQLLSQAERYAEAAQEYEIYLESNPGDVGTLSSLASVMSQSGMTDSAQAIYDGLLSDPDLGIREYFNIGVGLYTAQVFERAAEAFRRVAEVAPENRDAVYNLSQSLYEAEDWEALLPVARSLVELDGYNADSYTTLAQALINTDAEQEAVDVLTVREDLPFRLEGSQLQPRSSGGASVSGQLVNNSLEPGTTVVIRVHFNGDDGAEIGSAEVRVTAPEQDCAAGDELPELDDSEEVKAELACADRREPFRADLTSDESVLGFYFEYVEIVSPR